MEMIENPMVMPEYSYKFNHMSDETCGEMEDRAYQDKIFEEMNEEEN